MPICPKCGSQMCFAASNGRLICPKCEPGLVSFYPVPAADNWLGRRTEEPASKFRAALVKILDLTKAFSPYGDVRDLKAEIEAVVREAVGE